MRFVSPGRKTYTISARQRAPFAGSLAAIAATLLLPACFSTVATFAILTAGCGGDDGGGSDSQSRTVKFSVQWADLSDPSRATVLNASRAARSLKITLDGGSKGAFAETFDRPGGNAATSSNYESRSRVNLSGSLLGNADPNFTVTAEFTSESAGGGVSIAKYGPVSATVSPDGTLVLPNGSQAGGDVVFSVQQGIASDKGLQSQLAGGSGLSVELADGGSLNGVSSVAKGIVKRVQMRFNGTLLSPRSTTLFSDNPAVLQVLSDTPTSGDDFLVRGITEGNANLFVKLDGVTSPNKPIMVTRTVTVSDISATDADLPMTPNSTRQFVAKINNDVTGENGTVKWKIASGTGATIDENSGLLSVGSSPSPQIVVQATSALDPSGWQSAAPPQLAPNAGKTTPATVTITVANNRFVTLTGTVLKPVTAPPSPASATAQEGGTATLKAYASSDASPQTIQTISFTASATDGAKNRIRIERLEQNDGQLSGTDLSNGSVANNGRFTYTVPKRSGIFTLRATNLNAPDDPKSSVTFQIDVQAANINAVIK